MKAVLGPPQAHAHMSNHTHEVAHTYIHQKKSKGLKNILVKSMKNINMLQYLYKLCKLEKRKEREENTENM